MSDCLISRVRQRLWYNYQLFTINYCYYCCLSVIYVRSHVSVNGVHPLLFSGVPHLYTFIRGLPYRKCKEPGFRHGSRFDNKKTPISVFLYPVPNQRRIRRPIEGKSDRRTRVSDTTPQSLSKLIIFVDLDFAPVSTYHFHCRHDICPEEPPREW